MVTGIDRVDGRGRVGSLPVFTTVAGSTPARSIDTKESTMSHQDKENQEQADRAARTCRSFAESFKAHSLAKNDRESFINEIASAAMQSMALMFEKAGRLDISPSDMVDQGDRN